MAKQARDLLAGAEKIQPDVLHGSIYTTLGSLYYQVPGWPLGFGDNDKARDLLQKALQIDPDGIDANYFYGDFLNRTGDKAGAMARLDKALAAPPRPDQPLADKGRRAQVQQAHSDHAFQAFTSIMDPMNLREQRILLTGAAGGIGRELCRRTRRAGRAARLARPHRCLDCQPATI